jgi:hypothetical protein
METMTNLYGLLSMNLEDKALSNGVIYIHSIDRDISNKRLTIHFWDNPEFEKVVRTLSFTGVENFVEYFGGEEEEGSYLQSVIGIDETSAGVGTNYAIRLELSELHFYSEDEPIVQDPPQSPLGKGGSLFLVPPLTKATVYTQVQNL